MPRPTRRRRRIADATRAGRGRLDRSDDATGGGREPPGRTDPAHGGPVRDGRPTRATADAAVAETGTTVVAVATDRGAAMAADRRASLGGQFVANRVVRKIEPVHPTAALALSGTVGEVQIVARELGAEASLYEHRRGDPPSIDALATLASSIVRGRPVTPLLAGVDDEGGHAYRLDGGGAVTESPYAAAGSGMQVAYGRLDGSVEPDATLEAAIEAAAGAVATASERDAASGDGVTVARITAAGVALTAGDEPGAIEFDDVGDRADTGGGEVA